MLLARKLLKNEHGYSLVEVLVSILILSVAIIPTVGMFDAGLKAATKGGNYDQARALANAKLEEVKVLPYEKPGAAVDSVVERYPIGTTVSCDQPGFTCKVTTRYVTQDTFTETSEATTLIKITVEVGWSGNTYTTSGLRLAR